MIKKTSADYQREFRKRLRDQGLVKKEVWILPENTAQLSSIEKTLRTRGTFYDHGEIHQGQRWSSTSLFTALSKTPMVNENYVSIELIDGVEPVLYLIMKEYGDIPIYISASGEQILVESRLWAIEDIKSPDLFNHAVLQTHKYFPLSTISLEFSYSKNQYYSMFGALSSCSTLANIVLEIEALATNVLQATEAYKEFLNFATQGRRIQK